MATPATTTNAMIVKKERIPVFELLDFFTAKAAQQLFRFLSVELRIGGFNNEKKLVVARVVRLVPLQDRVIMHRQTVPNEHPDNASQCRQKNRQFVGNRK